MASSMNRIIMLAVGIMVVAVIFPLALGLISVAGETVITTTGGVAGNETLTLTQVADTSVITLLTVLLPIIAVIAIILYFLPKSKGG